MSVVSVGTESGGRPFPQRLLMFRVGLSAVEKDTLNRKTFFASPDRRLVPTRRFFLSV